MYDPAVYETVAGGIGMIWLIVICVVPLLFGAATATVAQARGYNGLAGFILGFFFGIIALLVYGFLPDDYQQRMAHNSAQQLEEIKHRVTHIEQMQAERQP